MTDEKKTYRNKSTLRVSHDGYVYFDETFEGRRRRMRVLKTHVIGVQESFGYSGPLLITGVPGLFLELRGQDYARVCEALDGWCEAEAEWETEEPSITNPWAAIRGQELVLLTKDESQDFEIRDES